MTMTIVAAKAATKALATVPRAAIQAILVPTAAAMTREGALLALAADPLFDVG